MQHISFKYLSYKAYYKGDNKLILAKKANRMLLYFMNFNLILDLYRCNQRKGTPFGDRRHRQL